jgi:uncharacterized protein with HEPN domain
MPREYRQYLADILTAAAAIEANVRDIAFEKFKADSNRVKAVLLDIVVIGEASHHIPEDIQAKAPEVAWEKIVGMRNLLVHGYWLVNYGAIWETASRDIPRLRQRIKSLLKELDES